MGNPHHLGGKMTRKELIQKIHNTYLEANFEIITWDGVSTHPITIRCLDCGQEKTYTRIYGLFGKSKTRFCSNCSETKSQREVREILEDKKLEFIRWANEVDNSNKTVFRVEFRCPKCNQITNRRVWEMLHSDNECGYCGIGHRRKKTSQQFINEIDEKYPGQYELLDTYDSAKSSIRVKHLECGFIFKIRPDNLLHGRGCPRCNRYNSIGSKAIKKWLEDNNITYETEKNFEWIGKKRYDFFLPDYKLLIEFNGIQHYQPIEFFLQNRTFEEQQLSDEIKKKEAIKHNFNFLVIKYDEVDKIPQILSDSTTIS